MPYKIFERQEWLLAWWVPYERKLIIGYYIFVLQWGVGKAATS